MLSDDCHKTVAVLKLLPGICTGTYQDVHTLQVVCVCVKILLPSQPNGVMSNGQFV